ncbi:MAG: hypothetical protein AAGN82_17465 [Myxococcota bacterium]
MAAVPEGFLPVWTPAWWREGVPKIFFVMTWNDGAIRCEEVRVRPDAAGGVATLQWGRQRARFRYEQERLVLQSSDDRVPESAYIVGAASHEAHVLRQPLPIGALFYRKADAERWFRTGAACERAYASAAEQVQEDGTTLLSLGIHAPFHFEMDQ